jgi:hypothetical protein
MIKMSRRSRYLFSLCLGSCLLGLFLVLALAGCNTSSHTSDPHLRQIDEMLNTQLPQGTPKSRVMFFLNTQAFPLENSGDAKVVVAVVRHVDTNTLQPATARVTFHFDASGKLTTYELSPAPDAPPQP